MKPQNPAKADLELASGDTRKIAAIVPLFSLSLNLDTLKRSSDTQGAIRGCLKIYQGHPTQNGSSM